ncbi:hypothetical protein EVAR_37705_1 [Eumeta japonica]|uniref:Uncharacterized protein n=1 Tax=Eumeta variegata TaxID=151549 RepID=A0A4C1XV10_EUMVA|nr:hypothetical protein EVAR_37705_1 [Eumeta japonica]
MFLEIDGGLGEYAQARQHAILLLEPIIPGEETYRVTHELDVSAWNGLHAETSLNTLTILSGLKTSVN